MAGHRGRAPKVKTKARLRLEMASDRLARQLLNITTDPNVADPVKLAAIKDALDRSGIQAKPQSPLRFRLSLSNSSSTQSPLAHENTSNPPW